jgi:hypothetical protein
MGWHHYDLDQLAIQEDDFVNPYSSREDETYENGHGGSK